jgi:hypothetical protein
MLSMFALLAWSAVQTKSPTYDEPLHAVGAWLHLHYGDFRVNPEDPPIWHYWAALPNGPTALHVDLDWSNYRLMLKQHYRQWGFVVQTLYGVGGVDADGFIARSRAMMLLLGVALGALLAHWAWRLAGAGAAITATMLFAFDPNLLAHAPLVKNDVALALVMLAVSHAVWHIGQHLTPARAVALGLLCGAGLTIKFSALLLGPIIAIMFLARAMLPTPWPMLHWSLERFWQRLIAAAAVCMLALALSVLVIWAAYGFRYLPSDDPGAQLDLQEQLDYTARNETAARLGRPWPSQEEIAKWRPSPLVRTIVWAHEHRVLPQAWLHGLLYTHQSTVARKTYLLGQTSITGWWYYFPLTMLFKSPLSLLGGCVGAACVLVWAWKHGGSSLRRRAWAAACLGIPPAIYLAVAMASNLNLGLRHILPVYPFIFLGIGLGASWLWHDRPVLARRIGLLLAAGLVLETAIAFPNYISFFNAVAGAGTNELNLLSDSNLDWGQDLPALADWQQGHLGVPLYLAYFGTAAPAHYGIEYRGLAGGFYFDAEPLDIRSIEQLPRRGVLAVSATTLQGVYVEDPHRALYEQVRTRLKPMDVLGGSIYLYDLSALPSTP